MTKGKVTDYLEDIWPENKNKKLVQKRFGIGVDTKNANMLLVRIFVNDKYDLDGSEAEFMNVQFR